MMCVAPGVDFVAHDGHFYGSKFRNKALHDRISLFKTSCCVFIADSGFRP